MKKSPITKFFVIFVLVFFLLSTGLMFVLYLASPSTIVDPSTEQATGTDTNTAQQDDNTVIIPDAAQLDVSLSGTLQQ